MASNQERAADLIANATIPLGASVARGMDRAILAAQALAGAGLLMADLPEPRDIGSGIACLPRGVEVWDRRTVHVYLADDYGQGKARLTPQEARAYGEELIAAANYAEQDQSND